MTTGALIKEYRKKLNIGQAHLAELCLPQISISAIRKIEAGVITPSEEQIEILSIALGVTPLDLKESTPDIIELYDILLRLYKSGMIEFKSDKKKTYLRFKDEKIESFITNLREVNELKNIKSTTDANLEQGCLGLEEKLTSELIFRAHSSDFYPEYHWASPKALSKKTPKEIREELCKIAEKGAFHFYTVKGRLYEPKTFIDIQNNDLPSIKVEKLINGLKAKGIKITAYQYNTNQQGEGLVNKRFIIVDENLTDALIYKVGANNWPWLNKRIRKEEKT